MNKRNLIFLVLIILTACKITFKDEDLISYNIYNVNDTLVFKNKSGQIDEFKIVAKSIINKGMDANTGWYNPQVAYVNYIELEKPNDVSTDGSFLTIWQLSRNEIDEMILFKGFIGSIDRKKQRSTELNLLDSDKIYKVPNFDMKTVRDSTDISYIFWSDKVGIIAYDYKNQDRWVLQND